MRVRSLTLAVLASAVSCLILTCQWPLSTSLEVDLGQSRAIFDGTHNGGSTDFFFLPPIVDRPASISGIFDANQSPTVDIRLLGAETPTATYTLSTGPGSETVRVMPAEQHYIVNWHTGDFALIPGATYRVSVLLGGCTLGFADVLVTASGADLKLAATGELVPLLDGRTLPIKFRIEKGALTTISPSGGTVTAMDGRVRFEFPTGAVGSETPIVVAPRLDYPMGPSDHIVPQTVFDFGPDGISFDTPITVTIAYTESLIPEELPEQSLSIVKLMNGVWTEVPNCRVDPVANTVSGALYGFSIYAVAAVPSLCGTIRDGTGQVSGALVRLYNDGGYSVYTVSDSDGYYEFFNVPIGSYYLVAKHAGFVVFTTKVEIKAFSIVGMWDYIDAGEDWSCDRIIVSDDSNLQLWYFVTWADGSGYWVAGPNAEYAVYDVIYSGTDQWYRYTMTTFESNGLTNFYWLINDFYTDAQGSYMRVRWRMKTDDPSFPQGFPPDFNVEDDSYWHTTFRLEPNPQW